MRNPKEPEISKLALWHCENLVISPEVFESFDRSQVEAIVKYFEANIFGPGQDYDDPKVFLFGPVPG